MYNEELTTWREFYIQQQAQKVADSLGSNKELQYFIKSLEQIYQRNEEEEQEEAERIANE